MLELSPFVIGCMKLGKWGANLSSSELEHFIDACTDHGLFDFDHADIYGAHTTEAQFGEVLKRRADLKNKVRVTTKCGIQYPSANRPQLQIKHYNSDAAHISASIDLSLSALAVEQIHLFLLHRPDYLMHPHEVAKAIERAKEQGKIKHFGVSNFSPSQLDLLHAVVPIENHQVQASVTHLSPFQDGTLDQLLRLQVRPTAWSPFGGGKIFTSQDPRSVRIREAATVLCEKYACALDQLLVAWLMRHPAGIVPVTGTSKAERVISILPSLNILLTHEDWYQLWTASTGEKVA